jgi:hypothetical protein
MKVGKPRLFYQACQLKNGGDFGSRHVFVRALRYVFFEPDKKLLIQLTLTPFWDCTGFQPASGYTIQNSNKKMKNPKSFY